MRLAVRGWRRDQGETVIAEADLLEAVSSETSHYEPRKVYLSLDSVLLRSEKLALNGRYLVSLELSDSDLIRLLIDRFGHLSLPTIMRMFRHPMRKRILDRLPSFIREPQS